MFPSPVSRFTELAVVQAALLQTDYVPVAEHLGLKWLCVLLVLSVNMGSSC